jgi:hypothetical protein
MWKGTAEILKADAGQHEDEAEDEAKRTRVGRQHRGDLVEPGIAGEAVDQRAAVEQHAGGERAEHEILQAGFRRAQAVAVDGGTDVERQRLSSRPR